MTDTFPDVDALVVDVLGARPAADPDTGAEAVEIALQPDGEEPQVFSLDICAAYQLREALDEALEAPFWWEEASDDERLVASLALRAGGAMRAGAVVDLARERSRRSDEEDDGARFSLQPLLDGSVRWDERWAPASRR